MPVSGKVICEKLGKLDFRSIFYFVVDAVGLETDFTLETNRKRDKEKLLKSTYTYLIFVTNITNEICGDKFVMWRNFRFICTTDVEKSDISSHVEQI